ncbi:MAG: UDP-N-acetylmuramate--L-alanine ligase [Bacillota bacterium]|jgi:UDP-N-acetylmuramate--alanine ligase
MEQKEWTHFIGIGGAGMSGLAKVLLELGFPVSGSDLKDSASIHKLRSLGAKTYLGHKKEYLPSATRRVVISSAIPPTNPELVKARELGLPVMLRAELLAELMLRQKAIAVAGSHGKTTTASMIAWCLEKNNLDPTVVIGGELNNLGDNAKLGGGEYLVAEADESDGSFLKLHPYIALVTNIEDDHLDYYGRQERIVDAFRQFLSLVPAEGFAVLGNEVLSVCRGRLDLRCALYSYGLESGDYQARQIRLREDCSQAQIYCQGKCLGQIELHIPGKHNIYNALGAVALCHRLGLEFSFIAEALASFQGAKRRFQFIGAAKGIKIVDDYAHHPTEIMATLKAARQWKPGRLWAVFQPHRFSRTKQLYEAFGHSFQEADYVIISEIYPAGESPIPGVTAQLIVDAVAKNQKPVVYFSRQEDLVQFLQSQCSSGDLVLTLGAGDIWQVGQALLNQLRN